MSKGIKHKDIGQELTEAEWLAEDSHDLDSGTSFPVSPSEKDRFYRSDEHKWYIFNGADWKALGGVDISDADATVGDVKDTKTFYSVEEPKKTGTMPTKAIVAGSDLYEEGYHAGDAGGLDAIDTDLAPTNIKSGVTVFGFLGTFEGEGPEFDVEGVDTDDPVGDDTNSGTRQWRNQDIVASGDFTGGSKSIILTATGIVIGFVALLGNAYTADPSYLKLRLFIDGVQSGESGYLQGDATRNSGNASVVGNRQCLLGSRTIEGIVHNYDTGTVQLDYYYYGFFTGGGSVK